MINIAFSVHYIYRMSQEECARLREGVPYVKLYRKTPKHLYPKLNGLGDNGNWKLWTLFGSKNDSCQLEFLSTSRSARWTAAGRRIMSPLNVPVWCIVLWTVRLSMTRMRGTLQLQLTSLCHSQVTLMKSTDINITETTYSCQFQYEFGNQ